MALPPLSAKLFDENKPSPILLSASHVPAQAFTRGAAKSLLPGDLSLSNKKRSVTFALSLAANWPHFVGAYGARLFVSSQECLE
jgi:hypothetical protein